MGERKLETAYGATAPGSRGPYRVRLIGLPFGAAAAASIVVLLLGMGVFGFRLSEWDEGQGRIIGVLSTVAAVAAAAFGVRIALRAASRDSK